MPVNMDLDTSPTEEFEQYQYGIISAFAAGIDYYRVVDWVEANIPADRWRFMGIHFWVIGFKHQEDWLWLKLTWG